MKKGISKFFSDILICNFIFLLLMLFCNWNVLYKDAMYSYIYEDSINFSSFEDIFNKYLGGVVTIDKLTTQVVDYVFDEKISYTKIDSYYDGAKLEVVNNYLVPIIREGIVVYIGEKSRYGSVVIVEDSGGIYNWYGNICNSSLKLYDRISKKDYIGQSCDDYIYLVFSKENIFLDYDKFV